MRRHGRGHGHNHVLDHVSGRVRVRISHSKKLSYANNVHSGRALRVTYQPQESSQSAEHSMVLHGSDAVVHAFACVDFSAGLPVGVIVPPPFPLSLLLSLPLSVPLDLALPLPVPLALPCPSLSSPATTGAVVGVAFFVFFFGLDCVSLW